MPYVCDAEKTSAVMVCCEAKGLGGDEEVELLREPCMNGLLERFEGLVLLGLGPPAISSFVVALLGVPCWEQRGAVEAAAARRARRAVGAGSRSVRIEGEHCRGGLGGGCCLGVKQLRNVVMPGQLLAGAAGKVEVAREKSGRLARRTSQTKDKRVKKGGESAQPP